MTVFTPEVIAGVRGHMNGEHTDDALRIVQGLGNVPQATAATLADMNDDAAVFEVAIGGDTKMVAVPWARPINERMDVRLDIVRMHTEACEALGIEPPAAGEH